MSDGGNPSTFDPAAFRKSLPTFADVTAWPDDLMTAAWTEAIDHIPPTGRGRLSGDCRRRAIYLLTAHILTLDKAQASGGTTGIVQAASIDKVSVTLAAVPVKNQFQWWLSQTSYGARLLALLKSKSAGGLYVGGLPAERAGFRKAGGVFENGKGHS